MNNTHHSLSYFIGIDIGTQGARVALMDSRGNIISGAEEPFELDAGSREEQSPLLWWEVCHRLLQSVVSEGRKTIPIDRVKAMAVTSTSGTVIPLGKDMTPLHNAIMYSDPRSADEGKYCREMALKFHGQGYTGFNASSGLSKMLWFLRKFPERVPVISRWIHASDYVTARLCNVWDVTDYTNVLKSGYDVREGYWPSYLFDVLGLREEWLPKVVLSGTPIGALLPDVASTVGLPPSVMVVAGMTDGCASQIASGAVKLGDWNTTIGTTLVIKGVTRNEVRDPLDRIYNHRHPEGYWMPGGAANIGADWVTAGFGHDLDALNRESARLIPTGQLAYPLLTDGERFPFISPTARGFHPDGLSRAELFAANMEGVAYVERYAFELIASLSGETVNAVYSAGGGSKSDTWLKIRSNVLGLPIYKMKHVSGAVGAAILAASKTFFSSIVEAGQSMTQIDKEVQPMDDLTSRYNETYREFIRVLKEKGIIQKEPSHA